MEKSDTFNSTFVDSFSIKTFKWKVRNPSLRLTYPTPPPTRTYSTSYGRLCNGTQKSPPLTKKQQLMHELQVV